MNRLHFPLDPIDAIALIGLAILAVGVALISIPAALIVVGAALLAYAILATRTGGTT